MGVFPFGTFNIHCAHRGMHVHCTSGGRERAELIPSRLNGSNYLNYRSASFQFISFKYLTQIVYCYGLGNIN